MGVEVGWWDSSYDNFTINQRDSSMAGGTGYFFLHVTKDTGRHWLAPFTEFADQEPRIVGKKWKSTGLEVTGIQRMKFNLYNTQLLYMGLSDIGGFVSEDGGDTLRMCYLGMNTNYDYAFDPGDGDVVYAAGSGFHAYPEMWYYRVLDGVGGIYRSNDRGRNWNHLTPTSGISIGAFCPSPTMPPGTSFTAAATATESPARSTAAHGNISTPGFRPATAGSSRRSSWTPAATSTRSWRWAFWSTLLILGFLSSSVLITLGRHSVQEILAAIDVPIPERELLANVAIQGRHLVVMAAVPMIGAWILVVRACWRELICARARS